MPKARGNEEKKLIVVIKRKLIEDGRTLIGQLIYNALQLDRRRVTVYGRTISSTSLVGLPKFVSTGIEISKDSY